MYKYGGLPFEYVSWPSYEGNLAFFQNSIQIDNHDEIWIVESNFWWEVYKDMNIHKKCIKKVLTKGAFNNYVKSCG